MDRINVAEARKKFSDLMSKVAYGGERIVVEYRGKPIMAWISIEELHRLETLEKQANSLRVQREAALTLAEVSRRQIRAEREGVSLPNSADVLTELREEQVRGFTNMR